MKTIIAILILGLASCDVSTPEEKHPTITERAIFAGWRLGVGHARLAIIQRGKDQDCQQVLDQMRQQGYVPDYFPSKEDAWNNWDGDK